VLRIRQQEEVGQAEKVIDNRGCSDVSFTPVQESMGVEYAVPILKM